MLSSRVDEHATHGATVGRASSGLRFGLMRARYPAIVLWICAVVFVGTGLVFTVMPQDLFAGIGLEVPDGAPVTELRAVYGGLELAIGVFLVLCARRGGPAVELGLLLSFLGFLGLASFRGTGMAVELPQVPLMSGLLLAETAGALFALSGWMAALRSPAAR